MWKNWAEFVFGSALVLLCAYNADNNFNHKEWLWFTLDMLAALIWWSFAARAWRRI